MTHPITVSQFYALSQGSKCEGVHRCHWCGAPCNRRWLHDEPKPVMFQRTPKTTALFPDSPWICVGCWLFRRQRITTYFLDEKTYLDRQCPATHSWWITPTEALSVRWQDGEILFKKLLNPPRQFSLMILVGDKATCLLHQGLANDFPTPVQFGTQLKFTINGIPHTVSPMELQTGLKSKEARNEPGVRALLDIYGVVPGVVEEEKPGPGKPIVPDAKILKETTEDMVAKRKK